jgi:hypothetical protein
MSDERPGYFESEIEEYPGSFTLPHPFLDRHMRKWWDAAFEQRKGDAMDYDYAEFEWQAYVALILEFGEWEIKGVPKGDLDGGGMVMEVKVWVTQEASEYLIPFLPRNRLRTFVGTM